MSALVAKALKAAQKQSRTMYLYCTAVKWVIDTRPPGGNRQYIQVTPDAIATYHEYDYPTGQWSAKSLAA